MSIPKRRPNQSPAAGEPRRVQVGSRHSGGELSASLRTRDGEPRIYLNAFQGSGQTVDVSLADAAALRDGLTGMLEQAGYE